MAVDNEVLADVLGTFATTVTAEFASPDVLERLAEGAVRVLQIDGAGIMVPYGEDLLRFAFATGPLAGQVCVLEQLQERLQEGPCRESRRSRRVVDVADLATPGSWPAFQQPAVQAGLHAVTALPLVARDRTWGVLDLYRARPGQLDPHELAAAHLLANLATSYLVVADDRDAARQAKDELAYRAMHDPLTGLPVRWVFLEQLAHALSRLHRHPGHVGVLFIDLDGLKYVNDTFGHDAGDRLIRACVQRIQAALRPNDVIARLGGDEFVVLLEDLTGDSDGQTVAQRILTHLAEPSLPDGHVLQPSASLGLALTDDPTQTPDALIAHADSAMYRAKHTGRGRYQLFDAQAYAADRADADDRDQITRELRTALREGQLDVHYQPIIDLTATTTAASPVAGLDTDGGSPARPPASALYAVEALVRWHHPRRGLLPAAAFVPFAERAGLVRELGAWVIRAACEQLAAWDRDHGARAPRRLFLNASVDEVSSAQLPERLRQSLDATGIDPDRITIEITESGLFTSPRDAQADLQALRDLGCHLAIDDFGSGYSSLSRLVDLPADTLKIDRSLTAAMADKPAANAVVAAVLRLGRDLDRTIIVEGIEDGATVEALRRLGGRYAQGYHLAGPLPAGDVPPLLT